MSSETGSRSTWERPRLPRPKQHPSAVDSAARAPSGARSGDGDSTSAVGNLLWVTGFFALTTIILTYPISISPSSASRLDNGDARLNAWAISWVAHQLVEDPLGLFQANIFHPLPNSLAFSEHLLVEGIIAAPILWLTNDLVLTQNVIFLLATFLGGISMYLLTSSITGSRSAGLVAGLFFTFAPYRFNRLPHIQMQMYGFIPLTIWALIRYFDAFRRRWLVLFTGSFVLQVLSGTYLAAMAAISVALAIPILVPWKRAGRREWLHLAASLIVASILIVPFVLPYLWVNRTLGVEWDLEGVASLAATPRSYLAASSHLHRGWTETLTTPRDRIDFLFPSFTLAGLALAGTILMLRRAEQRRIAIFLLLLAGLGVLISLGPATPVYRWLFDNILFFRGLRALPRFSLLALVSMSVVAAAAVSWIERRVTKKWWVVTGLAMLYVCETTALPYQLENFRDKPPAVYDWLATAKPGTIVELPFKVIDTRYMFWARHHGFRPMLNGDSGFIPESHNWMKQALQRFPSDDSIELLRRQRVRYVVLHLGAFRKTSLVRLLNGLDEHRSALLPVRDFGRDAVFEILPPLEQRSDRTTMSALEPVTIATSEIPQLVDLDHQTPFKTEAHETSFTIQVATVRPIRALRIHYGAHPRVPVERIELSRVLDDGSVEFVFETPAGWPAISELVDGLIADPRNGAQLVHLPPTRSEVFRLRVFGMGGPSELTEIEMLAAATGDPPSSN